MLSRRRRLLGEKGKTCRCLVAGAVFLTAYLTAASAIAEDQTSRFSAGAGVAGRTGIYVGEAVTATYLAVVRYDGERFSVGWPSGLRLTWFETEDVRVSGLVAPRLSQIEFSKSTELDGLDRQTTADIGLQATFWISEGLSLRLRAVTELTDEHGGSELSLSVSHTSAIGQLPLVLGGGFAWQSDDLSSYLYGVSAAEATGTRQAYRPGDVLVPHLSIGTEISLTDRVTLGANLRADFLPDEVAGSPIIDESLALGAFVRLSYKF